MDALKRISSWIYIACIVLLPTQTVWLWRVPIIDGVKWQYGTIGLYGTDILLLVALMFGVAGWRKTRFANFQSVGKPRCSSWIHALIAVCVGLSFMSIFRAEDELLSAYFFAKLLLASSVFWLAYPIRVFDGTRKPFRWLWIGVIVVAVLESLLGISQFLTQTTFASKWLGMSEYQSWQPGVSVLKNESGRWLRAYGTFPHPNIFGAYLGVVLTAMVSWLVIPGLTRDLGVKRRQLIILSVLPILLLGLTVSFSRTAWAGVFLALGVLIASVLWRSKAQPVIATQPTARDWARQSFGGVMGVLLIVAIIFAGILHETIFPRFERVVIDHEASVIDRVALLQQAGGVIAEHPFFGVGAGNYTLAVMRLHPEIPVWDIQPVHNVFVLVFAELGIVGGLIFVAPFLLTLTQIFRTLFIDEWQTKKAIASLTFLVLIPSLFLDHFLWDSHFGLILLILLLTFIRRGTMASQ